MLWAGRSFAADADLVLLIRREQEKGRQPAAARLDMKRLAVTPELVAASRDLAATNAAVEESRQRAHFLD